MPNSTDALVSAEAVEGEAKIIGAGDVALVLKKDGTVQALTFGYERGRLLLPPDQHTDEDRAMMEQGKKLFALAFAAGNPRLMSLLIDIASDPDVIDFDTLTASKVRH